jgi:leucyl aminopeptidase
MRSSVKTTPIQQSTAALLAVGVPQGGRKAPASLRALDKSLNGEIGRVIASGDFSGKPGETAVFYPSSGPKRVLLVGLGEANAVDGDAVRKAAAHAARRAVEFGASSLAFALAGEVSPKVEPEQIGRTVMEGAGQGGWVFEQLRSKRESKADLGSVQILTTAKAKAATERGRKVGAAVAAGQAFARDLQMRPGNHCTPSDLATEAKGLAERYGHKVGIKGPRQLQKDGMNALLAVAQGSAEEPRFITLEYRGAGSAKPVCLVGKGVTFDSGGISIKPALNMEEMKFDMSGAAAVLGTFEALGRLKPRVNVVGLIPTTENLPSSTAVKPGDVVETHFGKTVEIINTDAEGRLILCDALSYARQFKPACILDIATLTGSIVIALGDQATGLMGNDDDLLQEVRAAGTAIGEPCWELPLWEGYRQQLKSDTADLKNVGGRPAGSITAGWFLKEFVDKHPWAHLDIAGTAWLERDRPDIAKGPTGVGVRLFTEFSLRRAAG